MNLIDRNVMANASPVLLCVTAASVLSGCDCNQPESDAERAAIEMRRSVKDNSDCGEAAIYRFDAVSPDRIDNRRIFIDFQRARTGVVTRGSLSTDSHFLGPVDDCSTDEVRCVDAGQLIFAWPKDETKTSFAMGNFSLENVQCTIARRDEVASVSCVNGEKLVAQYRVQDGGIDQATQFYPDDPAYPKSTIFEAVDYPIPLCKL